jgi:UDP-N-acetylglucosamine/UDP-N-acetylgalactosamine diphosphorylase
MKRPGILKIEKLVKKGVKIPNPDTVEIGDDVNIDRISGNKTIIHSGCKIFGSSTLILHGAKLGYEGPVTVENCQVGPRVNLNAGFFKDAVFLKRVSVGFGSHIRKGTILEEESSISHTVGLKQIILFPFVTLGSLINFCDCLMAGGTSRKNHSEVGSSYIHFNYTPEQDKATPSLIGDVPGGVMLNQNPIFLGGQGGLVGPCRLAFGTIIAAGTICRKDELRPQRLIFDKAGKGETIVFTPGAYIGIKRIVINNIIYIANLTALMQWYIYVRTRFISDDFPKPLFAGLKEKLYMAIDERIKRFKALCDKMQDVAASDQYAENDEPSSIVARQKHELYRMRIRLEESFVELRDNAGDQALRDVFLERIDTGIKKWGKDYITVIKGLESKDSKAGTMWLQGIVDNITIKLLEIIPSFRS